jgi:hypothetical protein
MSVLTLKQITTAMRISRDRVEQWIARGYFRTPDKPILGKPRDWSLADAIRLAVCVELVDSTISPEIAGQLTKSNLHGFKAETAYFVAWRGPLRTAMKDKTGTQQKAYFPENWYGQIVQERRLVEFLKDMVESRVINLNNVEQRVKSALDVR